MVQGIKADKTLGTNIQKARNAMGITQDELAARLQILECDISRGALAKIEVGIRHVSVKEIKAIKIALKMKYEDFFN